MGWWILIITDNISSSPIIVTLMMEAMFLRNAGHPRRHYSHSDRSENLKFYIALTGWAL
jgi:hypothetical protein